MTREKRGRAYAYRTRRTREEQTALRMEQLMDTAGNRTGALTRFIDALSESERRHLREMLGDDQ